MTQAHGDGRLLSRASITSLPSSSSSFSEQDDATARVIRERLREHRGMLVATLAEKLSGPLLQELKNVVLTAAECDQVLRKQRRKQRASSLLEILQRKNGTSLKVVVDLLRTRCPRAYDILHVPENEQLVTPTMSPAATFAVVDDAHRRATDELTECLSDTHHGGYQLHRKLRALMRSGVDIALISFEHGLSLLHEIIRRDREPLLKPVFYAGLWSRLNQLRIDADSPTHANMTPLELAGALRRPKLSATLEHLTAAEAALDDTARCVRAGECCRFREIRESDPRCVRRRYGSEQWSLLEFACMAGMPMLLDVVQVEQEAGLRPSSTNQAAALCVELGHHDLLDTLQRHAPFDVDHLVEGRTLAEVAAMSGDSDTFNELQRRGARMPETLVALAAAQNRLPFLRQLFSSDSIPRQNYNVNFQDRRQKTAGHFAADKGYFEVLKLLLDSGLHVTACDKRESSLLHSAASSGSLPTVDVVLEAARQQNHLTSMIQAKDKYIGAECCFLVRGRDNRNPAWHYVEADRALIDVFRRRTQGGSVEVADYGRVVRSGWGSAPSAEVTQQVESTYDTVNVSPTALLDMTPVHIAILKMHEAVAQRLIAETPDVNQVDCFGLAPLHLAAMRGMQPIIDALLRRGANRTAVDHKGRTPADIAEANDHHAVAMALRAPTSNLYNTEDIRSKLLRASNQLSPECMEQLVSRGQDPTIVIRDLLREVVFDINDYLYDNLQVGPVAAETGSAGDDA